MEKVGLVILGRFSLHSTENIGFFKKEELMTISQYLSSQLVLFLQVDDPYQAIEKLVNLLDKEKKLLDRNAFLQAVLEREKIVSTGIGIGVAIPHAKLSGYKDFFIVIGIQKSGIAWNALDDLPVRIIFMIGGPENQQTKYLKILSLITSAIKEEPRRRALLQANTHEEVIAAFEGL